ncbi:MAG TPA: hypothetical protein VF844_04825 [Ktedonobacteraceae bacterium]
MKKGRKSAKYFSIEKKNIALELSEQEWQLLDSIRSYLIPGRPGIVAGVMRIMGIYVKPPLHPAPHLASSIDIL